MRGVGNVLWSEGIRDDWLCENSRRRSPVTRSNRARNRLAELVTFVPRSADEAPSSPSFASSEICHASGELIMSLYCLSATV